MIGRRVLRIPGVLLLALAGIAAACGIPVQESAQPIDEPPPELFETFPSTTSTTQPDAGQVVNLRLYWHTDRDLLVVINRQFSESPDIQEALDLLTEGPSVEEQGIDPTTFIQRKFNVSLAPRYVGVDIETGEAIIEVNDAALFREDSNRRVAASEIVCTALQFENVDSVSMQDSLGIIPLTDLDAEPIDGPAMAVHYDDCVPPPGPVDPSATNGETDEP